ncbi:MAG: vWA domain-containing protein [Candidatus Eremiobacterota bacterium]
MMRTIKVIIVILLITSIISGCQKENLLFSFYIAMDCSGSTGDLIFKRYFGLLKSIVNTIPKRNSWLAFYTFASEVTLQWSGKPAKNCLWAVEDKIIKQKNPEKGTRVDLLLEQLLKDMEITQGKCIHVVIISDGGDDGSGNIKPLIQKMAGENRIKTVFIIGIKPENRIKINNLFQPLGAKLTTAGLYDTKVSIAEWRKTVRNTKD